MEYDKRSSDAELDATADTEVVAQQQLSQEIYYQLRLIARRQLRGKSHTELNTTALVHEAYLRIVDSGDRQDSLQRARFLAIASTTMRNLLIDHVRKRKRVKHGGDLIQMTLEPEIGGKELSQVDVLAIEDALIALSRVDPRLVNVVECRFYAGMDYDEIAMAHNVSERTARRDWRRARAFLKARLGDALA
ncbi:ECF-type sigma factor [Luteimonas sp. SX5]|uniref:ECF-type sigma factor n=1 Tax=Luteimonas galliterrae TaxID=2940486 RepID=A0ABT0MJQ7_9GAMM|nr:ECF-type sigma factor [Luteimonas galliterrae]MCL1635088.1 ECF-type sigma factor [Luteimonas galliterrae]